MPCQQINQVVNLLQKHDIRPSSSDVVAIVCASCNDDEVCPSRRDSADENESGASSSVQMRGSSVQVESGSVHTCTPEVS
ncbi:MAG: hypothetical protein Aurels2KO_12540 [Aureliella sp.]